MNNNTESYLSTNYVFEYNEIKSRTLFKLKKPKSVLTLLGSYDLNSIWRGLANAGYKMPLSNLQTLLNSNFVKKVNPIKDYFEKLPKWDGKIDYIDELAKTVVTNDDEFFRWAFKKWLVSFVGCAVDKNVTNHQVLVLVGKQGCGKTTWLKNLVPLELRLSYTYNGTINPNNKDCKLAMSEYLLMNLDEMSTYNKFQIDAFKEMITVDTITERKPYGHFSEDYTRIASFTASSNDPEILLDVTGNRRFLCNEASEINYLHAIDLNLVYSQAYTLFQTGFQYYFDSIDTLTVEENNKKYMKGSVESDYIDTYFKKPENGDIEEYLSATEIGQYIKSKGAYFNLDPQAIGKNMTAKGYAHKKIIGGVKKYIISKK